MFVSSGMNSAHEWWRTDRDGRTDVHSICCKKSKGAWRPSFLHSSATYGCGAHLRLADFSAGGEQTLGCYDGGPHLFHSPSKLARSVHRYQFVQHVAHLDATVETQTDNGVNRRTSIPRDSPVSVQVHTGAVSARNRSPVFAPKSVLQQTVHHALCRSVFYIVINPLKPNASICYTLPYRPNVPFSITDIRAL